MNTNQIISGILIALGLFFIIRGTLKMTIAKKLLRELDKVQNTKKGNLE